MVPNLIYFRRVYFFSRGVSLSFIASGLAAGFSLAPDRQWQVVVQCGRKATNREKERKKKRPTDMLMRRDVDDSTTISAPCDVNLTQLWSFQ